jgi:isocitrate dehydrogenase
MKSKYTPTKPASKRTIGVDVFLHWRGSPNELGAKVRDLREGELRLSMITNRGVKVWPEGAPETFCTDHWRLRFKSSEGAINHAQIAQLLGKVAGAGFDFIKTENLCEFDGEAGYSLGQGQ